MKFTRTTTQTIALLSLAGALNAQSLTSFENGRVADANAVNANFNVVQGAADRAQTTADSAQASANAAQTTANSAQNVADMAATMVTSLEASLMTLTGLVTPITDALSVVSGNVGIGTMTPEVNLQVEGASGVEIQANTFNFGTPLFIGRTAGGTAGTPTAVMSGNNLAWFGGQGYDGSFYSGSRAAMIHRATEDWTTMGNGAETVFETTANGSTSRVERMKVAQDGKVTIGDTSAAYIEMDGGFRLQGYNSPGQGFLSLNPFGGPTSIGGRQGARDPSLGQGPSS